ncbi:MAG: hypothetical protein INQ03_00775 [Candidatus Heimdallarchaeota archaeon]|nr:hypothetical protein [Candidatus Heimdallarchaeota archaeon]
MKKSLIDKIQKKITINNFRLIIKGMEIDKEFNSTKSWELIRKSLSNLGNSVGDEILLRDRFISAINEKRIKDIKSYCDTKEIPYAANDLKKWANVNIWLSKMKIEDLEKMVNTLVFDQVSNEFQENITEFITNLTKIIDFDVLASKIPQLSKYSSYIDFQESILSLGWENIEEMGDIAREIIMILVNRIIEEFKELNIPSSIASLIMDNNYISSFSEEPSWDEMLVEMKVYLKDTGFLDIKSYLDFLSKLKEYTIEYYDLSEDEMPKPDKVAIYNLQGATLKNENNPTRITEKSNEKNDPEVIERKLTFEKVMKAYTEIKIHRLAKILNIDDLSLEMWLIDIAPTYGFKIQQDILLIDQDYMNRHIDELFVEFEQMEKTKSGKIE